ncbi:MAG: glycosyltransferase [Defluviimonas sp.]|nr:glycosyltransferase [Defluviimonas sp.]
MTRPLEIVILGLSLSSSWGNGHATTFRALIGGLAAEGHRVLFLERDMPWYAAHRDLPEPGFCDFALYDDIPGLLRDHGARLRAADAVIVGSYVPEGAAVIDALAALGPRMLCFYDIDTPVTMGLLDAGEHQYLAPRQVPVFDIYFSFSGGEVLRHLEDVRGARRAEALYCSVDPALYAPPERPGWPKWDLGYLGTYSPDRQPGLEALLLEPARRLPDLRFVVAGSRFPEDVDWPGNVERIEHLPPAGHADFYGQQRFTLNITRAAMRAMGWSPSVRLFEAGACGTPVISDRWQGLDEVLPEGRAVLIADSTEDVLSALTDLPEARRRAIAAAARGLVLQRHTGRARALELARALRAQMAGADGGRVAASG